MPFPSGAQTITVTGKFPAPVGGTPRTGRVVFTPSARLVDSTQKAIYSGAGPATLDTNGAFTVTLLCTDDPDIHPAGWRWRVDEQPAGGERATYWIDLPSSLGSTIDLSAVAAVPAPDGSGGSTPTARPSGPAGGALTGAYPDPQLSTATIASFDPAGAAASAQTAAAADATAKANAAQTAATSAAATDATAKVAAHTNATDPHGDRAAATAALAAHAADSTDVHGIADTTALETQTGAQAKADAAQTAAVTAAASDATAKIAAHTAAADPHGDRAAAAVDAASRVAAHTAAPDPHGDRAYTDTQIATRASNSDPRLTDARTPTAHATSHEAGGSDELTLTQAQIAGLAAALAALLPKTGGTITGGLGVEGYTTLAGGQANNGWSAFGFLAALAEDASPVHRLDATTGVAAVGAKNGLANIRFCGLRNSTGAPTAGTWAVGDTVLDSAGALWLCTAAGTPGTWASAAGGGGSGSTVRTAKVRITDDNLSGLPAAASWTVVQTSAGTRLQCSIPAAAGDRIEVYGNFMYNGAHFLDWVLLDNTGVPAEYAASGSGSPLSEGNPTMYPSTSFSRMTTAEMFTVASGHISAGTATIALAHQGSSAGTVYAHPVYPWKLRLKNIGPEPA